MNNIAMRYAVIKFMPYIETREFANIGIVAVCPKTGFFGYHLEKQYGRLSKFFPNLKSSTYKSTVNVFEMELKRLQELVANKGGIYGDSARLLLDDIAKPREAIIRVGHISAAMTSDPSLKLNELVEYYVHHSFTKEKDHEQELTRKISNLLKTLQGIKPFRPREIGDDLLNATFPLVQEDDERLPAKAIKPMFFGLEKADDIFDKWIKWSGKVERLANKDFISLDRVMFTYQQPETPSKLQADAIKTIQEESKEKHILLFNKNDEQKIREFATS